MATGNLNRFVGLSNNLGGQIAVGLGAALAGVAAASVKMSIDFNASMAHVATLIPNNIARVKELKGGVQDLAIQTGKSTGEISEGLFLGVSAWGDTADAIKNVEVATRAAVASGTEVKDTVKLLAGVTKNYGDASAQATRHVADLAFKVDSLGLTTIQELIPAMTKVAPLTAAVGISVEQMAAVFATASGQTGTAARVSTQFQSAITALIKPTTTMQALYEKLGVKSGQALIQQRGFKGALETVIRTAEASNIPLSKLMGRIEGATLAMYLAGRGSKDLSANMGRMQNVSGSMERAFKQQSDGINKLGFQWNQLKQSVSVLGQTLGDELGKHLTPVVQWALDLTKALRDSSGPLAELKDKFEQIGEASRGFVAMFAKGADRIASPIYTGVVSKNATDFARDSLGSSSYLNELEKLAGRRTGGAFPQGAPRPSAGSVPGTSAQEMARRSREMTQVQGEHLKVAHKLTDAERALKAAQEQRADAQYKLSFLQRGMTEDEASLLTQLRKAPPALAQEVLQLQRRTKAITDSREAAAQARQERAQEHERFVQRTKDLQAEIRDLKSFGGLSQLAEQFPGESAKARQGLLNTERYRDFLKAGAESSRAAEEEENRVNQSMNLRLKQAQTDDLAAQARRKYGEVNRESLALESEWNAHYRELAPNQQKIIDQLNALGLAKEMNERLDEQAKKNAEDLVKAAERHQQATEDLTKAMEARRKAAEQERMEADEKQLAAFFESLIEQQNRARDALRDYADSFASVFTQAFRDVQDGSKGFFTSIVQGFEHMLQEMALKYIESKIANLFFGLLDQVFGGSDPLAVEPRALGGPVARGQQYLVGERGPELFTPRGAGRITPNAQLAGAGGHTFNIHFNIATPDVAGFQRTQGQLLADAGRQIDNLRKRHG